MIETRTRGRLIELLRSFHASMRDAKLDRAAFGCVDNRAKLEVAFIINEAPYALVIAARGVGRMAGVPPVARRW